MRSWAAARPASLRSPRSTIRPPSGRPASAGPWAWAVSALSLVRLPSVRWWRSACRRQAFLGGAALTKQGLLWQPPALAALIAWVVGATLFPGDVSARAFIGHRLFSLAAPIGGTILIAAWLALAAAALVAALQRG